MRTHRPWTRKEEALALGWARQGVKGVVIARRLGRTHSASRQRVTLLLKRSGLHVPALRFHAAGELTERVRKMARPGVPDTAIASILGVHRTAVQRARAALGLPPCGLNYGFARFLKTLTGERLPADRLAVAVILCSAANKGIGMLDKDIAGLTGHSPANVWQTRKRLGIHLDERSAHERDL